MFGKFFKVLVVKGLVTYIYCTMVLVKTISRLANGYLLTLFGGATP